LGSVAGDNELDARRQQGGQGRQTLLYAPDGLDDVEPGLLVDIDDDRALVLQPSGLFGVFRSIDGGADIGDADRCAVLVRYDEVLIGVGIEDLIGGVEDDCALGTIEIALRPVHGRRAEDRADIF